MKLIRWWVTPKLPEAHIFIPPDKRPKGIYQILRVYSRKWLWHPIKRRLARWWLKSLQKFFNLTVVALTGSAGKTTTKEMLAAILQQRALPAGRQGETVWSYANIDPVYNIPTTILQCRPSTRYLILEMGVEIPGEMDFYLWLAQPKVGLITNIYQTHTQFLGDIKGVATEKAKLVRSLGKDEISVLNKDNPHCLTVGKNLHSPVVWFGKTGFVRATNIKITPTFSTKYILFVGKQNVEIELPTLGEQFVENSMAAAATAWACGATLAQIKAGLESFQPVEHRMKPLRLKNGALVLDDSYNSNPSAAKAALETLKQVAKDLPAGRQEVRTVAVLGDMLELGKGEIAQHRKLGRLVKQMGINYLIGIGPLSKYMVEASRMKNVEWVEKAEDVMPKLKPLLKKNTVTLIKGSRSIGLDKVVEKLSGNWIT